jgi:hypothetical protein
MPFRAVFGGVDAQPRDSSRTPLNERRRCTAKRSRVIRVPVPIDVGTIAAEANGTFGLATPLRVDELLALAVREVLGSRAPLDKVQRGIRNTLAGLRAGKFVVVVDGRVCHRADQVVVCEGIASLRFFARSPQHSRRA